MSAVDLLPGGCSWHALLRMVLVGLHQVNAKETISLFFSDHYGRLPTIIIANLIALVTGVATPFVTERISFFVLRFKAPENFKLLSRLLERVSGFSWDSLSTLSSPYLSCLRV